MNKTQESQIVDCLSENWNSKLIAEKVKLPLAEVNNFIIEYRKKETFDSVKFIMEQPTKTGEVMTPARSGYYKNLVSSKMEENSNLKEQRGWLLEQVYYLRKAVAFLEVRKGVLERGISDLEKNINAGIPAIEQLEENNNFENLSPHVEKKNK